MWATNRDIQTGRRWLKDRWLSCWAGVLICQVWAFLLFLPALAPVTITANRYFLHWDATSWGVRFLAVLLVGLGLFTAGRLMAAFSLNAYQLAVVTGATIVVASLGWQGAARKFPEGVAWFERTPLPVFLGAGCALLAWRLGWNSGSVARVLGRLTLVISPVVFIFWGSALFYPSFQSSTCQSSKPSLSRTLALQCDSNLKTNVYVFIFDDWSYRLTFGEDGQPGAGYPNLRRFAGQSAVFTNAHSPSCYKLSSVPRLLFQETLPLALRNNQTGFLNSNTFESTHDKASLFTRARAAGFKTYLIGWLHPYRSLLGDSVDFIHAPSAYHSHGSHLLGRAKSFSLEAAVRFLGKSLADEVLPDYEARRAYGVEQIRNDLLATAYQLLDAPENGQFAVFHLPGDLSALPFSLEGPASLERYYRRGDERSARRYLRQLDQHIGEILSRLETRGKFDNSTIVLTSDRAWARDPALSRSSIEAMTHVPLMIKLPNYGADGPIEVPISSSNLAPFLFEPAPTNRRGQDLAARTARARHATQFHKSELRRYRFVE